MTTTFLLFSFLGSMNAIRLEAAFTEFTFHGAADVSAIVFLDANHFAAANDESNTIRIYSIEKTEKPAAEIDLSGFLRVDSRFPEADIEAVARAEGTLYWITSHGRNKDGKERPSRYRFFAAVLSSNAEGVPILKPFGSACGTLMDQFMAWPSAAFLKLEKAVRLGTQLSKKEQKRLAPKKEGLNIEAMTYLPKQGSVLIGLRNPLYRDDKKSDLKAIAFEVLNPEEVVKEKPASFGRIVLWDLGRRGLRGMEYDPMKGIHYVIAGPVDEESSCALYIWDGNFENSPVLIWEWERKDRFTPEAIAVQPVSETLWIASDDGMLEIEVGSPAECREGEIVSNSICPNKFLTDDLRKTFRVQIYELPLQPHGRPSPL